MADANSALRRALRKKLMLLRERQLIGTPPAKEKKGISWLIS